MFATFEQTFSFAQTTANFSDKKTICTAKIDEDFCDDKITVVLGKDAVFETYTQKNFSEIGCAEAKELTEYTSEFVKNKLSGKTDNRKCW